MTAMSDQAIWSYALGAGAVMVSDGRMWIRLPDARQPNCSFRLKLRCQRFKIVGAGKRHYRR